MNTTNESNTVPMQQLPSLLETFSTLGMFASREVHADTITLPDGRKALFHVREMPDAEFRTLWADGDRSRLIAATICDEAGKPVMNFEQAARLKPLIAAELQRVAMKHSGFGEEAAAAQESAGND